MSDTNTSNMRVFVIEDGEHLGPRAYLDKLICEAFGVPEELLRPAAYAPNSTMPPKPDDTVTKESSAPETIAVWANRVGKNTVLDWAMQQDCPASLEQDLATAINCHSAENGSNTPDFILGKFLAGALQVLDEAMKARDAWYQGSRPAMVTDWPEIRAKLIADGWTPPIAKPDPMARTTDAPRWDLSGVTSAQMLEELRKREGNEHNVAQPGEDLGCLREQAQAWMGVVNALSKHWPEWTDEPFPCSRTDCATLAIADMAAKAKRKTYEDHEAVFGYTESWKLVCKALDQFAPGWNGRNGSGQQCAVAAIEALSKRRELSANEAEALARKWFEHYGGYVPSAGLGAHSQAKDWVIDAIRAASRGEGGAA